LDTGTLIIYGTASCLVLLLAWLVFRLARYRSRRIDIEQRAKEISRMSAPPDVKRARAASDRSNLQAPAAGILLVMHRAGESPARGMFVRAVEGGRRGIVVTSEDPRNVPLEGDVHRIWLNRSTVRSLPEGTAAVNPTNLSGLLEDIASAQAGRRAIVLLDRFEELMAQNDIDRVMRFLNMLRDRSARDRLTVLVPLAYKAVPQRVRSRLMEAFETVVV